jgi:hypothetical protein
MATQLIRALRALQFRLKLMDFTGLEDGFAQCYLQQTKCPLSFGLAAIQPSHSSTWRLDVETICSVSLLAVSSYCRVWHNWRF